MTTRSHEQTLWNVDQCQIVERAIFVRYYIFTPQQMYLHPEFLWNPVLLLLIRPDDRIHEITGLPHFSPSFTTSNAARDKVVMAQESIDILSSGAHLFRFSQVAAPAGSNERRARRGMASGSRLTRPLSTESFMLSFLSSESFDSKSGPNSDHASNKRLALDWVFNPTFAIIVTAKGIRPSAVSNNLVGTSGSLFGSGLISW